MKKIYLTIILGMFLISLTSALYAGETITYENTLNSENLIWTIIDNSSEITILPIVTINSTSIKIYFPNDMPPNSFTIVFLEEETKEIIKEVQVSSGGGGGTRTQTIIKNQTEYIEVPNYITLYQDSQDSNETIPTETPETEPIEKSNNKIWIILEIGILVLLIVGIIVGLIKRSSKSKIDYYNEYNNY